MAKSSKHRIEQAERDQKAIALRRSGMCYSEIAARVGYANRSGAYKAVMRVLEEIAKETAEDASHIRSIELQRLDDLLKAVWDTALAGDPKAIDRVLKIMDRRARFLGLDAPTKQEVSGPDGDAIRIEDARTVLAEAIARVTAEPETGAAQEGDSDPPE